MLARCSKRPRGSRHGRGAASSHYLDDAAVVARRRREPCVREVASLRDREHELLGAIDDLEARLAAPRPLDERELLEALGEETTRLLRNAREAAEDIRQKADERAMRL